MTSLQYLLNFGPTLDDFKSFQWTRNSGIFLVQWSIAALKFFKENVSTNFDYIAFFVKVASEIAKRVQCCVCLVIFVVFVGGAFSRNGWGVKACILTSQKNKRLE